MNEQHIRRIRKQFILISTLSLFGVMLLMGGMVYVFNRITINNEIREIADVIIENDGEIPGASVEYEISEGGGAGEDAEAGAGGTALRSGGRGRSLLDGQIDAARVVNTEQLDGDCLPLGQMLTDVIDIGIGDFRNMYQPGAASGQ